jgi:hypothetical protein
VSFYNNHILPHVINLAMRNRELHPYRERVVSPQENVRKWQNRLTPVWKRIGGGCHLNRPIRSLIENAGFRLIRLDTGYAKGPRPMTFFYEGCAAPRRNS